MNINYNIDININNSEHNLTDDVCKTFITSINNDINVENNSSENNKLINTDTNIFYDDKINYDYISDAFDESNISPYKEIIRYHCINGLNDYFKIKLKDLDPKIYNVDELFKNNSCKLVELINRWCWHQYNNPSHKDEVIPYVLDDNYDYERFVKDLNYILDIHGETHSVKITDAIIFELKKLISEYLFVEYSNFKLRENIQIKIIN